MLRELRVRNFAVVETVTVTFEPGLNVLTGETGAGKSILVDAILLVRGARAQTDIIRTDSEVATVEALFDVPLGGAAASVLDEAGLALDEGQVVLRRELSRSGRHRAFVNDSPVTVALLDRLGDCLIEVHGQHEHQRLLEPARQLELVDGFAVPVDLLRRVADLHAKFREARGAVERLRAADRDRAHREDLLRHQVSELTAARLRVGEDDELRAERRRLQNAERFRSGLEEVASLLRDDADAAGARIARAARVVGELGRLDPSFAAPGDSLDAAAAYVEDALSTVRRLAQSIEGEPDRLEAIEDRLEALTRLKRKYGDDEAAMLAFLEQAAQDLERLERHEGLLAGETRRLEELRGELLQAAASLTASRIEGSARLATVVQRGLRSLGMERAEFSIQVQPRPAEDVTARGVDQIEFRLSANPGEELRPLARIASGGELSRTMLAIHAALAATQPVPTMVFDEVDAGIGGRVAGVVADMLFAAARGRQVLCVTHLPQIAARADHHLHVDKTVRAGRTRATVRVVSGSERVDEIARMLGGAPATDTARRHARELLGTRRR